MLAGIHLNVPPRYLAVRPGIDNRRSDRTNVQADGQETPEVALRLDLYGLGGRVCRNGAEEGGRREERNRGRRVATHSHTCTNNYRTSSSARFTAS